MQHLLIVFTCILLQIGSSIKPPNLSSNQINALYDLYDSTNGSNWYWHPSNTTIPWNVTNPNPYPCEDKWQGLTCSCNHTNCDVVEMILTSHRLTGPIPDSFSQLQYLEIILFDNNFLSGQLPESFSSLESLFIFSAEYNYISGSVPKAFGSLPFLLSLNLNNNHLTTLPNEIFINNQSLLRELKVDKNKIVGTISLQIENLKHLEILMLSYNKFFSTIPSTIGNLEHLRRIDIGVNHLNGTIPDAICKLTNLSTLSVANNTLTGKIPTNIGQMTKLRSIYLINNRLHGFIPNSIGNLSNMYVFAASGNLLSGSIPSSFSKLTKLYEIEIEQNSLTGTLDALNLNLNIIDYILSYNFFHGNVTHLISNPNHIQMFALELSINQLTGLIPIPSQTTILEYLVNGNYFTGNISQQENSDYFLSEVNYFSISQNLITGSIPNILFQSMNVTNINISYNLITGTIPFAQNSSDSSFRLDQLLMNNNFLSGTVSSNIGYLTELIDFTAENNQLSGALPPSLKNLARLERLLLQNNKLSGSLDRLMNLSLPFTLKNVDISNNRLTGSISSGFFLDAKTLSTFAIVSNCLEGSIPATLCAATNLTALALDGLSTANNCQDIIFPFIPAFSAFTLRNPIAGTIPECLYSMPNLQTLHASGNAFTGSISSELSISPALTDLSLSHNLLSGTIPLSIQERGWENLDLSYNKLTGTLSNNFQSFPSSGSLYLDVNRLSGDIPSVLLSTLNISILNGNIFSCNAEESDLPKGDPSANSYSCGSNTVNSFLYMWTAFIGVLVILIVWMMKSQRCLLGNDGSSKQEQSKSSIVIIFLQKLRSYHQQYSDYAKLHPESSLASLQTFFLKFRKALIAISIVLLFVLLPFYSVLTVYTHSYSEEYVWTISGILLSGETAALAMEIVYFCFALFVMVIFRTVFEGRTVAITPLNEKSFSLKSANGHDEHLSIALDVSSSWKRFFQRLLLIIADVGVMVTVDILYVVIVLNYDAVIIALTALALAVFRILINTLLVWKSFPFTWNVINGLERLIYQLMNKNLPIRNDYIYSSYDVSFLEILMLVNNILIPVIAILIVLPDCFYNAFFEASNVQSSYSYKSCAKYLENSALPLFCQFYYQQTEYSPPFLYSYQCSSKIIINYVPVYLISFFLTGIFLPLKNVSIFYFSEYLKWKEYPRINKIYQLCQNLLPYGLKDRKRIEKEEKEDENAKGTPPKERKQKWLLFPKLYLTTQWTSSLAVIVAIGGLFPPLAIIGCFAVIIGTYEQETIIGKVIVDNQDCREEGLIEQLEEDCEDIAASLELSLPASLLVSCLLFAYIIFDTWGDETGWEDALAPTLVMIIFPMIMIALYELYRWWLSLKSDQKKELKSIEPSSVTVDEPVLTELINHGNIRSIQMSRTSSTAIKSTTLNPILQIKENEEPTNEPNP